MEREDVFMKAAIDCARTGLAQGNLPVGAVLVINGELVDRAHNSNHVNRNLNSHAETIVIGRQASRIYSSKREKVPAIVELFTTWEPCLMCFGTSALNRIDRIVYACPDPRGGTSRLTPEMVGEGYQKLWPIMDQNITFREESYDILLGYMAQQGNRWDTMMAALREVRTTW